ncbi:MAG: DnaJ domain-containing protein [Deltaproteobacteria bacterium]|nr:DnaJ domain-containing protein [Deltaproteobacteria bacterium]
MEHKNYYEILGVEKTASPRAVKEAYRKLAFQYHPDRNNEPGAAARMKEINEAYAVLSNPQKRGRYDSLQQQFGSAAYGRFRQGYSEEDIFRGSDIRQVYEEISRVFGFRGFDEVFRQFYGQGYQGFEFRRPGFSARGFVFRATPRRTGGSGTPPPLPLDGPLGKLLKVVLKKQWGVELPEKGKDRSDTITIPPELAWRGGKIRYLYRLKSKELVVTIPPRIGDGQKIRLRGMGDEGKGGAEPGDLYVSVRVRKPLIQRLRDAFQRVFLLKK